MVMAHVLRYIPITDTEQCFTAAQLIVDNGTFRGVERPSTYFARCTNNLGFVRNDGKLTAFIIGVAIATPTV